VESTTWLNLSNVSETGVTSRTRAPNVSRFDF
jgi:hypothetical protein